MCCSGTAFPGTHRSSEARGLAVLREASLEQLRGVSRLGDGCPIPGGEAEQDALKVSQHLLASGLSLSSARNLSIGL